MSPAITPAPYKYGGDPILFVTGLIFIAVIMAGVYFIGKGEKIINLARSQRR